MRGVSVAKSSTKEESVWRLLVYHLSATRIFQCTVSSILDDLDVICNSNDIKDCHLVKGDRFKSQRKSSKVLNKKKKL